MTKISLLRKEQKEHLKVKAGQAKRGSVGVFKIGLLHNHLSGCGLTILIDNYKLQNNRLSCVCLSHNSVCYSQMYVCIEYSRTLNRLSDA